MMSNFYVWDKDDLILNIRCTPNAKSDVIGKVRGDQLKVSIKASPNEGKATDYLIQYLANEFGVPRKNVQLVFGQFNINKQIRIKNPKKFPATITLVKTMNK